MYKKSAKDECRIQRQPDFPEICLFLGNLSLKNVILARSCLSEEPPDKSAVVRFVNNFTIIIISKIMAKNAYRQTFFYFLVFWLFSAMLTAAPAFARGSRDADLSAADALIENKQYDEATLILTDFARRYPNRFDLAQQRLKKIALIREEFNRTANEMINTLLNDSDNSEKILELSLKLGALENEDSLIMASFINRTQEIAQFNVYRNRLQVILESGRAALDRGEPEAAIQIYSGGMDLMRTEFFAAGYGEEIDNEAASGTERVNSVIAAFRAAGNSMSLLSGETIRAINSGNFSVARETISRLTPAMDNFIRLRQELYASFNTFENILSRLRASDPEIGDRNYLAFVNRVIEGRADQDIQEGMFGAFELLWNNSIGSVLNAVARNMETVYSNGLAVFNAGNFSNAVTVFEGIQSFAELPPLFFEKRVALNASSGTQASAGEQARMLASNKAIRLYNQNIMSADVPVFLNIRSLSEAADFLILAADFGGRMNTAAAASLESFTQWQAGTVDSAAAMASERQERNNFAAVQNEIERIIADANQADTVISGYSAEEISFIKNAVNAVENVRSSVIGHERLAAVRFYTIANSDLRSSVIARTEELDSSRNFLDGQIRESAEGNIVIDHYPAEALQTLAAMLTALDGDLTRGNSTAAAHRNEPQAILNDTEIAGLQDNSRQAINELTALRSQARVLSETARSRTAQAETFRREGERLFRESQNAFQRQDFETARDRLTRAAERMNNSLDIQASASFRQSWDTQILDLAHSISIAENELIIAEVRNMVNSARATYFAGNFQQAEDSLLRARNRWRVTNADENQEVLYWLGIVRGAMSARSGRVIPPTAPLYPEMSQLLSEARRNFEEGVRYINAGSRRQGLARFDEARLQTREVRLMFPVNQEAGILELRMEQYTDPSAFNAGFEQRLRNAVAGTKRRSIESFADLQNLAEINPNYPGIRGILNQAEIDMGFRPPPPNPANLARSRELTTAASRIYDENNIALFEVAIAQLNEAISLNPENVEATRVKDRLLNRMSIPGGIVLSSEDESEYQRAVREFQSGNNLVAFTIVERLMQNPRNRNITKLVELQRRIQLVLS